MYKLTSSVQILACLFHRLANSVCVCCLPVLGFDRIPRWGIFVLSFGAGTLTALGIRFFFISWQRKTIAGEPASGACVWHVTVVINVCHYVFSFLYWSCLGFLKIYSLLCYIFTFLVNSKIVTSTSEGCSEASMCLNLSLYMIIM